MHRVLVVSAVGDVPPSFSSALPAFRLQIGWRFWDLVAREHAQVRISWRRVPLPPRGCLLRQKPRPSSSRVCVQRSQAGVYDDGMSTFFRNVSDDDSAGGSIAAVGKRRPAELGSLGGAPLKSLRARAVLVDMEEGVVNQLLRSPIGGMFDRSQLITDVSGAGNNWAHGYGVYGPAYRDALADNVRRCLEACESPQSFFMINSSGGGTGSGVGSYMLEFLADAHPELYRFCVPVFPSETDDVVTSPYNFALTMRKLSDYADCILPLENQALADIVTDTDAGLRKACGVGGAGAAAVAAARGSSGRTVAGGRGKEAHAAVRSALTYVPRPMACAAKLIVSYRKPSSRPHRAGAAAGAVRSGISGTVVRHDDDDDGGDDLDDYDDDGCDTDDEPQGGVSGTDRTPGASAAVRSAAGRASGVDMSAVPSVRAAPADAAHQAPAAALAAVDSSVDDADSKLDDDADGGADAAAHLLLAADAAIARAISVAEQQPVRTAAAAAMAAAAAAAYGTVAGRGRGSSAGAVVSGTRQGASAASAAAGATPSRSGVASGAAGRGSGAARPASGGVRSAADFGTVAGDGSASSRARSTGPAAASGAGVAAGLSSRQTAARTTGVRRVGPGGIALPPGGGLTRPGAGAAATAAPTGRSAGPGVGAARPGTRSTPASPSVTAASVAAGAAAARPPSALHATAAALSASPSPIVRAAAGTGAASPAPATPARVTAGRVGVLVDDDASDKRSGGKRGAASSVSGTVERKVDDDDDDDHDFDHAGGSRSAAAPPARAGSAFDAMNNVAAHMVRPWAQMVCRHCRLGVCTCAITVRVRPLS